MGAFSGMKDAKRGFASNPLRPGKYVVRIDACDFFKSDNGEYWKNTLTILAVDQGDHKVGEVVNTFFKFKDTAEGRTIFQQNLKSFMAGILACEDEQIDESAAKRASGEEQTMRGMITVVSGVMRTSKNKVYEDGPQKGQPKQYPVFSWAPSLDAEETLAAIGAENYKKFFPSG